MASQTEEKGEASEPDQEVAQRLACAAEEGDTGQEEDHESSVLVIPLERVPSPIGVLAPGGIGPRHPDELRDYQSRDLFRVEGPRAGVGDGLLTLRLRGGGGSARVIHHVRAGRKKLDCGDAGTEHGRPEEGTEAGEGPPTTPALLRNVGLRRDVGSVAVVTRLLDLDPSALGATLAPQLKGSKEGVRPHCPEEEVGGLKVRREDYAADDQAENREPGQAGPKEKRLGGPEHQWREGHDEDLPVLSPVDQGHHEGCQPVCQPGQKRRGPREAQAPDPPVHEDAREEYVPDQLPTQGTVGIEQEE